MGTTPGEIAKVLPLLTPEKKVDVLMGLMSFLYPKRKATALQVEIEDCSSPAELKLTAKELYERSAKTYSALEAASFDDEDQKEHLLFKKLSETYKALSLAQTETI